MSATMEQSETVSDEDGARSPWSWVPSLYFAEGIPYVLVNTVSVVMFAKMGVPNPEIAFWTSLLAFPWVVKPLWGPLVDLYWTKRRWVVLMQFLLAGSFLLIGAALQSTNTFSWPASVAETEHVWWWGALLGLGLAAVLSATHDIAADGFYMVGLSERRQALFVGIRSTFYRMAMIFGQGVLVIIAGLLLSKTGPPPVEGPIQIGPKGAAMMAATAPAVAGSTVKLDPPTLTLEAGTTAPVMVSLTAPPKDPVVVTVDRKQSSFISALFPFGPEHLIKVTKGDRLEFNAENWNQPKQIVVEADAKVKQVYPVAIRASAGDIDLTWTYCFMGMFGLFLVLGLFHAVTLPLPAADGAAAGSATRPPFLRAFSVVLPIILFPIAVYVGLFYAFNIPLQKVLPNLPGWKIAPEMITFLTNLLVVLLVWMIFLSRGARRAFRSGFEGASRLSGIEFAEVFISFFRKPGIGRMIAFLLLYRLGEALLLKMAAPFLLKPRSDGGLGLTQAEYGLAYGTCGILALIAGGILGGVLIARGGLKRWLLPMCLVLNVPHLLYVYLAYARPEEFAIILPCVAVEAFGYGFGFSAYMMYMLYIAGEGEHKTSHFAIATGFMALSMMLPGMISGTIQASVGQAEVGYQNFFLIVVAAALPGLLLLPIIPLDPNFGFRAARAKVH